VVVPGSDADRRFSSSSSSSYGVIGFWGGLGGLLCRILGLRSQLEYNYLSNVTGNPMYAERSNKFYDTVLAMPANGGDGLLPNCWKKTSGRITMGADGDSYGVLISVFLFL